MSSFDFKSYYSIYQEALLGTSLTQAVKSLFAPIFELKSFPNNPKDKDDTTVLEIDNKRASEWVNDPHRSVRQDVARAAQKISFRDNIVNHFETEIVPNELDDSELDDMIQNMLDFALDSDLTDDKKEQLQKLFDDKEIGEFLAQAFIFALAPKKKEQVKTSTVKSTKAMDEFDQKIRKKRKKPETTVPVDIDEAEMDYVNALLEAYEEASGDEYSDPDDVKDTEYEGHFRQQRKNYYQAETIHRAIRDSVSQEDEDFEVLKEEIEDGIYTAANAQYPRGIDKANTVLGTAGALPISQNTDNYMLGWVGPGEKRGVCHMLVNDHKLTWVEDKENEK